MSERMGRYDPELQMFVQASREPDQSTLEFLRWLAENDRLEHEVAGQSSGELVEVFNAKEHAAVSVAV